MVSQFDKQDALRSLEVAKRAAAAGDLTKAKKFATKAKKLCDCAEVTQFLKELASKSSSGTPPKQNAEQHSPPGPSRRDEAKKEPSLRQRPGRAPDPGTPEQRALIGKIKKAKDFYETLDLTHDATEDDIKRSYKKLALKLHPDKNKAHGAEEAFKAVSRAFSCLSDPKKRENYDRFGSEESAPAIQRQDYHNFYAEEIDPDQIFNMFFGGAFPMHGGERVFRTHFHGPSFRRSRRPRSTSSNGGTTGTTYSPLAGLFSLLPLLLFILMTYLSRENDEVFSLYKQYPFEQEMVTRRHQVPFFVKSRARFERTFPLDSRERDRMEHKVSQDVTLGIMSDVTAQVEEYMKGALQERCLMEKRHKKRVTSWKGKEEGDKIELKACLQLKDMFFSDSPQQRRTSSTTTKVH